MSNSQHNPDEVYFDPGCFFLKSRMQELHWLVNPHVPDPGDLRRVLSSVSSEERQQILERARVIGAYARAIEEAIASTPTETAA